MPVVIAETSPDQTPGEGSLWAIRQKVVEFSGRYDLITDIGEDSGIDFFIKSGQRFLDRMLDIDRLTARYTIILKQGDSLVRLNRVRSVKSVQIERLNEDWKKFLRKVTYEGTEGRSTLPGSPDCYYISNLRHSQSAVDSMGYPSVDADIVAGDEEVDALRVHPRADMDYKLTVRGLFYSAPLITNESRSFWSVHYPEILIQAALLQIEKFMRNTEGVRDQVNALKLEVQSLDFDHVTQQIEGVDQMEG